MHLGISNEWVKALLALAMVATILLIIGAILFFRAVVPEPMMDAFLLIVGALLTRLSDAYGYYFGDNAEAAQKNRTINTLAEAQSAPLTTTTTTTMERTDGTDERAEDARAYPVAGRSARTPYFGAGVDGDQPGATGPADGADPTHAGLSPGDKPPPPGEVL